MRTLGLALGLVLAANTAWAACTVSSVQVKDNTGATPLYTAVNDGTNCAGETALVAGGAIVSSSNGLPVTPTASATIAVTQGTAANLLATVSQGGTWNLNNISGTVTLPTGASTAAKQPAIGTAGVSSVDVLSVQGIASGTALPISGTVTANAGTNLNTSTLATSANQPTNAAQGSTTSGQTGNLVQGAVTTAAPTYVTAQTSPLSLTTGGALRVDASAGGTITVGGTVTANQGGAPWSQNVTQFGGTNVSTGTGASGAGIPRVTISNDSSLAANQSVNVAQVNGTTVLVNTGAVGTGSQRVAVGTDTATIAGSAPGTAGSASANVVTVQGIASMTKLLVTPDANSAINEAQINGVTPLMGNGTTGTGSQRVTIASDNSAVSGLGAGATGSAVPTNAVQMGGNGSGNLTAPVICDNWTPINNAGASTNLKIITKVAAKQVYICSINLVAAAANNVALVEGTLTTNQCDTATAGLAGGATAATGWNLAANGGIAFGSGLGAVIRTATVNHDVCLFFSAANQVSGSVSWTQF